MQDLIARVRDIQTKTIPLLQEKRRLLQEIAWAQAPFSRGDVIRDTSGRTWRVISVCFSEAHLTRCYSGLIVRRVFKDGALGNRVRKSIGVFQSGREGFVRVNFPETKN